MFRNTRLVWKLNGVILLVLVCVLGGTVLLMDRAYRRDALSSALDVTEVISQTVVQAIRESMMTRDTAGMVDLFRRLAVDNPAFLDFRLISHGGDFQVTRAETGPTIRTRDSWPCVTCHAIPDAPNASVPEPLHQVTEAGESGRIVSVVTPIYGGQGCDASGCHADTGFSFIPGFLEADYSLRRVDDLIISRFFYTALALLVSLVLCVAATWWIVDRLVGRRIKTLREGAERVARKDFSFRFHDATGDGIAELSGTFDTMVSELSATLTELTETKEYLEGIVESSADVIITVDPSGLINTFNTGAEAVLGYEREEVVGKRIEILFADPTERDVAIERLSRTDHVVNYETHFLTKSGDVRDVILTLSRLRTPDGVPVGTFGISKDVTEEKRLQREVISKARLAAVGEAVTGMHHTLKNMLGALRGGSYMVNLGLEEDDRDLLGEGWKMVQEGIGHVTGLSSEMLEYVREWGPRLEECDLGDLLASVHRSGLNLARGKGIEVRVVVGLDSPTIKCDPKLIRSALMDLVVNAIEACEWKDYRGGEAPEVVLSACCSEDGQRVLLEVWDNGQGITDEIIENLFDPFFSTKRSTGTGMGLALASRVVRAHAGTIHVESEPNRGSTFRISIPVGTQQERKEKQNAQESSSY